jgi:4'-phosphopantetheinyl transferase
VPKRRRDFRLGRFAAKRALGLLQGCEAPSVLRGFEVRAAPGGAPQAFRDGKALEVALSISHSEGWASAAVQAGAPRLGCDLERVEARSRSFTSDYFTACEQAFVAAGPDRERGWRATLVWSAKEAVMKALGEGLRLPPPSVAVVPVLAPVSPAGWRSFSVSAPPTATDLHGFWRILGARVLTVAGGPHEPRLVQSALDPASRARPAHGRAGAHPGL